MFKLYCRNILVLVFSGLSSVVFSQQQPIEGKDAALNIHPTVVSSKASIRIARQRVDSVQFGTATVENGKAVIQLVNKLNSAAYDVVIVPQCNNCGQFAVSEKNETSFTVVQIGGEGNAIFSYNVFIKPGANTNPANK